MLCLKSDQASHSLPTDKSIVLFSPTCSSSTSPMHLVISILSLYSCGSRTSLTETPKAIHHSTLVDKIRIPFYLRAQLFFPFLFLVSTSPLVTKGSGIGTTRVPYFGQTLLHLNSAVDVLEIGWISWLNDIICSHDCARSHQLEMLAKLEIRPIGRLVTIKEHQVDVF